MSLAFTIADLIADPALDTHLIAGDDGIDRPVLWAHSCEMQEPDRWLGPHELLMTVGLCIPPTATAQRELIARLDDAGISGLTVGDDGISPRLTKAMLAEADDRGFPLLRTGPSTPFAAIGRTVAAANSEQQTMSVLRLAKLYQVAGREHRPRSRVGEELGAVLGTTITVSDDATGCVLIGDGVVAPDGKHSYPLRTHRPARLHVGDGASLDGLMLVHLTQILTVEANVIAQDAESRIADGAAALRRALTGERSIRDDLLPLWGQETVGFRAVVTTCETPLRLQTALALADLPTTVMATDAALILVAPTQHLDRVQRIVRELCPESGVSSEHPTADDLSAAIAEATAAHAEVRRTGRHGHEFRGQHISLLSRSRSEADQIISAVLGPLAEESASGDELRLTLFTFLDNDLHWNVTARALGLHRQGLVYRLKKIEALTGRSVRRTKDVSELWLARVAWRQRHASAG